MGQALEAQLKALVKMLKHKQVPKKCLKHKQKHFYIPDIDAGSLTQSAVRLTVDL